MSDLSARQFPQVYKDLGIDQDSRGCIMLDTEPIPVGEYIKKEDVWIDPDPTAHQTGLVGETEPHVTLLYGLMHSGPEMKKAVDGMLGAGVDISAWSMPEAIIIDKVSFFYGNPDEPNVAIVAEVKVTDVLLEGNRRLKQLPHIDTFPEYRPHITLAYVKDTGDFEQYVRRLNAELGGKVVRVTGVNYGH